MELVRYVVYFVSMAALMWLLAWVEISTPGSLKLLVVESHGDVFGTSEHSPIEILQPVLLGLCGLLYAWVARTSTSQRPLAFGLGGAAVVCVIRELHYFFDKFADNLWQVLVAVLLALLIVYLYRHRKRFRIAWLRLWPSPALTLLFVGAVIEFVAAQVIGHDPLWRALMGDDYQRIAKLAAEEFVETVGYCFWLMGSLEYTYQVRAMANR